MANVLQLDVASIINPMFSVNAAGIFHFKVDNWLVDGCAEQFIYNVIACRHLGHVLSWLNLYTDYNTHVPDAVYNMAA